MFFSSTRNQVVRTSGTVKLSEITAIFIHIRGDIACSSTARNSTAVRSMRAVIRTRFTELFGVDHPLMSAPMAMHSGATLAAAVSAAGGVGSYGGIHATEGPEWVLAQAAMV